MQAGNTKEILENYYVPLSETVPFLFLWQNIEFLTISFFHSKNALGHIKQKNKCNQRISEVPQCIVLFLAFHSQIYLLFTPFLYSESQTQERHKAVQKYFLRKPLFFDHKIDTATKLLNYVVKVEWSKLYFKRVDLSASGFYQQGPWLL